MKKKIIGKIYWTEGEEAMLVWEKDVDDMRKKNALTDINFANIKVKS